VDQGFDLLEEPPGRLDADEDVAVDQTRDAELASVLKERTGRLAPVFRDLLPVLLG
jgi:hypothetical protein